MKKRMLAILLAAAMLLCMLSACGSSTTDTEETSTDTTSTEVSEGDTEEADASADSTAAADAEEDNTAEAAEAPAAAEAEAAAETEAAEEETAATAGYEKVEVALPIADGEEISMYLLIAPFISSQIESTNDLSVLKALEERTGLVFDITTGNYIDGSSQVNLLIASGSYPDIINQIGLYANGVDAAVEEGVVIDLYDYIVNDVPNLMAKLESFGSDSLKQLVTANGHIGYFPQLHEEEYIDSFLIGVNQDIMDELGLSTPTTFDEFHDILTEVYAATGLQYGLSSEGADAALMVGLDLPAFGSNGTGVEAFRVIDGVVEWGANTDEMREYCEMMAQWFSEGLIFSDFLSYEDYEQTNMVAAGTLFGNGNVNAQTIGEAEVNGVNVTAISYLTRNEGDTVRLKGTGEIVRTGAWSISSSASEETIELILQLVNYIYSDEGTLLINYGVEGEGYELDADGNPQWTELVMESASGYTTAAYLYATATPSEYICGIYDDSKFDFSYSDAQLAAEEIIDTASTGEYDFPAAAENVMTSEEKTEATAIASDLSTYVSETALGWIYGQSVLDAAAWETFLANCESMNVSRLIEIYQGVYDRYMAE